MIALIQRVTHAEVVVAGETVGRIGTGLLAFIGVERGDGEQQAARLLERLLDYRVFADADGRMNLSIREVHGGLLLVPQFTLAADTRKGTRASFRRPPRAGPRLVRLSAGRSAGQPSRGRERPLRRRHAGLTHQRRTGHLLVDRATAAPGLTPHRPIKPSRPAGR